MNARVVVVIAALLSSTGCAEILQQCAGAFLQVTAQACVDIICDSADKASNDDDNDDKPAPPREIPAPDWQPHEGSCDVTHSEDGAVRVACPDGTRALFRGMASNIELIERESAVDVTTCTGAVVVREGIDSDGDGVLSPTEVTGRTVECPERDGVRAQTLVGHVAVHGPDDVARLAGRRALTGGLSVKSAELVRLELPELRSVGGTLRVDGAPALEVFSVTHLASIGGDVVVSREPALYEVDVPALAKVGGAVIVVDNPRWPEHSVEELVFRLSRHGFAGPVDLAGNASPRGDPPPPP